MEIIGSGAKNYKSVVFVATGTLGNTVRFILPQQPLYRSSDGSTFSLLEIISQQQATTCIICNIYLQN